MLTYDRWVAYFFDQAMLAASMSKDPSDGVGSVVVDETNRVVSSGYNGLPARVDFNHVITTDRETKLQCTLHAEENALAFAWRDVRGMSLFSTRKPCAHCAAVIVQRGIHCVAYLIDPNDTINPAWEKSFQLADEIFEQAQVQVVEFTYLLNLDNKRIYFERYPLEVPDDDCPF